MSDFDHLELNENERAVGMIRPQAQLEAAFELVKPAEHWKAPIDAVVSEADLERVGGVAAVDNAIAHFCGGGAEAHYVEGGVRFIAPGYWAIIGA